MDMKDQKKKTRARSKDKEKVNKKENYDADNCDKSTLTTMKREKGRVARMRSI